MKSVIIATLLLLLLLLASAAAASSEPNDRPIVAVLTMPILPGSALSKFAGKHSYLVASYVKYLEMAGARVAVAPYNADGEAQDKLFRSVNGVLFTGGGLSLGANTTYFKTAQNWFRKAVQANDQGDYFPIWGTCQGFQLLSVLGAGSNHSVLLENAFDSENLPLPLDFTPAAAESRLYGTKTTPASVLETLGKTKSTINLHRDGVTPEAFQRNPQLAAFFDVLSTNVDRKGRAFASTIEAKRYPFFATQWHPERNVFEWDRQELAPHTRGAIQASQFTADFFVEQTRMNHHAFDNPSDEQAALIYNYAPTYTGNTNETYPDRQTYLFD